MLDSLMPQPASIQKPNFDIVAWNDSFCRLMGVDFAALPEENRNCIYLYLTHDAWRKSVFKIAMYRRPSSLTSARRWPNIMYSLTNGIKIYWSGTDGRRTGH